MHIVAVPFDVKRTMDGSSANPFEMTRDCSSLCFCEMRTEKETTLLQHYQRRQLAPRPGILTGLMELISTSCDGPAWTLRLLQAIGRHHRETTNDKGFYISLFIFIIFCESLDANIGFVLSSVLLATTK